MVLNTLPSAPDYECSVIGELIPITDFRLMVICRGNPRGCPIKVLVLFPIVTAGGFLWDVMTFEDFSGYLMLYDDELMIVW